MSNGNTLQKDLGDLPVDTVHSRGTNPVQEPVLSDSTPIVKNLNTFTPANRGQHPMHDAFIREPSSSTPIPGAFTRGPSSYTPVAGAFTKGPFSSTPAKRMGSTPIPNFQDRGLTTGSFSRRPMTTTPFTRGQLCSTPAYRANRTMQNTPIPGISTPSQRGLFTTIETSRKDSSSTPFAHEQFSSTPYRRPSSPTPILKPQGRFTPMEANPNSRKRPFSGPLSSTPALRGQDSSSSIPRVQDSSASVPRGQGTAPEQDPSTSTVSTRDELSGSRMTDTGAITDDQQSMSGRDINIHRETDQSQESEIYMSVFWTGSRIGIAYYDVSNTEMYVMPDTTDSDNFHLLGKVLFQIQPSCVITSAKQDERLTATLSKCFGSDQSPHADFHQILPNADFSLEMSKIRILNMNMPTVPEHYTEAERSLYFTSLIQFDNISMVCAMGGLLKYLEKHRVGIELEERSIKTSVLAVHVFTVAGMLLIDEQTYRALQIFHKVSHPALRKLGSVQEGLSLYGLLNRCNSGIGAKMLRTWFLQPMRDPKKIQERLDSVAFFVNPRNLEVTTTLQSCLRGVKGINQILKKMLKSEASVGDWKTLYKTLYNGIHILDVSCAQKTRLPIFKKIGEKFTGILHEVASLITQIVDFEESFVVDRFVVKPNVDPQLDEKKRTYNGLPHFMTQVAREELDTLNDDIPTCNVVYLPQLGYLLSVPVTDEMRENGAYDIEGLDFIFIANNFVHYKSARTKELDTLLGDIQSDITDFEISVMHKLQNKILQHTQVLLDVVLCAAELDCLLSLAACAREFNYVKPNLTESNVLQIKGGRHPLQETCCSPFVPNDTISGGKKGKVKILTGPNACGKSVYLKQVALIVYMAQIGSFVPAEEAVIGLVDGIYTRIHSVESVSIGLSSFMLDLNQVSAALNHATGRSLVILDEFGKSTETIDGISLLVNCLKYWLDQREKCPHVFVSTHFHSVTQQQLLPKSNQLKFQTMEVLHDKDDMVFLYQLKEGCTDASYACHIAAEQGLPQEIINRGNQVSDLLRRNKPVLRLDTENSATQYKRCAAITSRFLDLDFEKDDLQAFLNDFVIPVYKGNIQP